MDMALKMIALLKFFSKVCLWLVNNVECLPKQLIIFLATRVKAQSEL